ncbi:MAG: PTS sugar transporter subunit IIA [Planctomycetota bacterium]
MSSSVSLARILGDGGRIVELTGTTADRVISELLECLGREDGLDAAALESIKRAVLAREREATTGIGSGIAIPHMKECPHVSEIRGVFGRSRQGVDFAASDGERVHLFFMMLTPGGEHAGHVDVMRKIVRISRDRKTVQYLIQAEDFGNFNEILQEVDDPSD